MVSQSVFLFTMQEHGGPKWISRRRRRRENLQVVKEEDDIDTIKEAENERNDVEANHEGDYWSYAYNNNYMRTSNLDNNLLHIIVLIVTWSLISN